MAEVGAWKNFDKLERSLTLEELIELYDVARERQQRMMKTIAAAFGAEFDDEDEQPKQGFKSVKDDKGNDIPSSLAPSIINSSQDAMMVSSTLGGMAIAFEQH